MAISHTPQRVDQVVVRQLVLLLLILDRDAVLAGIKAGDARLKKLDLRVAQDLRKRALAR